MSLAGPDIYDQRREEGVYVVVIESGLAARQGAPMWLARESIVSYMSMNTTYLLLDWSYCLSHLVSLIELLMLMYSSTVQNPLQDCTLLVHFESMVSPLVVGNHVEEVRPSTISQSRNEVPRDRGACRW
jgi:hypothetical protein